LTGGFIKRMKELFVRTLSGLFYVAVLILSICFSEIAFLGIFLVLGFFVIFEFAKLLRLKAVLLYLIFALAAYFMAYLRVDFYAVKLLLILTCFVNLFLFKDLLVVSMIPMYGRKKYAISLLYLI